MAVTVVDRPNGIKIGSDQYTGSSTNSSGDVVINYTSHGLSSGSVVYIESDIETYTGFRTVELINANSFYITENGERIPYKQNASVTFYVANLFHGWQCVHLPIVYKLHSDLLPNTVDTITIIGAEYESSPYMNFSLPDSLGFQALDYGLFKSDTDDPGTPYQILSVVSIGGGNSVITINKAQGSSGLYSFQKYYNNYYVLVNVYAGLPSGHHWESEKPYELAGTLKFIPDSNGDVMFSVSELLKGYITTRNNLQLDTLPNNIDFWTSFYIEYTEGYDTSNGTVVTSFVDELTSDQEEFEGQAVNAMLPFKNIYSGWMSEYVGSEESPGRWLTTEDVPIAVVGYFFDISFISNSDDDIMLWTEKKLNGNVLEESASDIVNNGIGVIRLPIEPVSGYDQYCIYVFKYSGEGEGPEEQFSIDNFTTDMDSWFNSIDGITPDGSGSPLWAHSSDNGGSIKITTPSGIISHVLIKSSVSVPQAEHFIRIKWQTNYPPTSTGLRLVFYIQDVSHSYILNEILDTPANSSEQTSIIHVNTQSIWEDADSFQISAYADTFPLSAGDVIHINSIEIYTQGLEKIPLTEPICINIVDECNSTILSDDVRLLESGGVRELE